MNLLSRLARDSLWLLTARIGAQASLVIVTYLLARRLGAEGFGEYAFISALILIANVLTTSLMPFVILILLILYFNCLIGPTLFLKLNYFTFQINFARLAKNL